MAKILIVDDDPDLVNLLTMALKTHKHDVRAACGPAEGLSTCREFLPDIVILDYHMPGDTGAHLFENIRRNKSLAKIPILFMSGEAHPDQILSEIADPSNSRFLSKPVQLQDLRRAIDQMLEEAAKSA